MDAAPLPRAGFAIAIATGIAMAAAGAGIWLAVGVTLIWCGSLWLARPAPEHAMRDVRHAELSDAQISPAIEPLSMPLLVLQSGRVVAANAAARATLGNHIIGQDARIALRHPQAIALIEDDSPGSVTIAGLTSARSVWQLNRLRIDDRYDVIECIDRTSESDIARSHTDFVANASHELRTPLASIIGYAETLSDGGDSVDAATRQRFTGTIEREARRMQALVEDLMSLSRIEAEKHDVPDTPIDLDAVIGAICADISGVRGDTRIVYHPAGHPAWVNGDARQIDQLMRNLIDNAVKYGDADKPVDVAVTSSAGSVTITVRDQGPGVDRDHLPHLTRRFYRTDPGRSRAAGGTGLGLAIVKHIVERHRGVLDIASPPGAGTIVTIRLPARTDPSSA